MGWKPFPVMVISTARPISPRGTPSPMNSATVFLAVFEISTRSLYVLVPTSTGGVADVPVELRSAVDLDDVADLEHGLVRAAGGVVRGDLVDADVAGEREAAPVLTDVTLHLLSDIVQLDPLLHHGEAELPGRSGDLPGRAELR